MSSRSVNPHIREKAFFAFESEAECLLMLYAVFYAACEAAAWMTGVQTEKVTEAAGPGRTEMTLLLMGSCLVFGLFHIAGELLEKRAASFTGMAVFTALMLSGARILGGNTILPPVFLLFYLLILLVSRLTWVKRIVIAAAAAGAVLMSLYGRPLSGTACAALILITAIELLRFMDAEPLRWIACIGILELFVLCLPAGEEPIDWSFLYRIGSRIREGVETIAADTGYFFSGFGMGNGYSSGYSGLGEVGDGSTGNEREELYFYSDRLRGNLYLTGTVHGESFRDGGISSDTADALEGRDFLDLIQTLYEQQITREEARLFGKVYSGDVELGYLRTDDVIYPGRMLTLEKDARSELNESGDAFERAQRKGYRYEVSWLSLDYGSPYLERILRTSDSSAAADREGSVRSYAAYEELSTCARHMYDLQLNLIVSRAEYERWTGTARDLSPYLSTEAYETERMRELAQTLTADAPTVYDACRAVEAYLRQYTYRRNTVPGPSENYIDDFLFRTGEGYCVHFASAMVMLLRLSGIPARYAEGYNFPVPAAYEEPYIIKGSNAHAWPEAWIDGIGWVPFEPTANRRTSLDNTWKLYLPGEDPRFIGDGTGSCSAVAGNEKEQLPSMPESVLSQSMLEEERALREAELVRERIRRARQAVRFSALIAFGLAAYLVLVILMIINLRRRGYKRADSKEKMERLAHDLKWLICNSAEEKRTGEPEPSLLEDYAALLPEEYRDDAAGFTQLYYRQRFGAKEAKVEEILGAEELISRLQSHYVGKKWRACWRSLNYALHARAF